MNNSQGFRNGDSVECTVEGRRRGERKKERKSPRLPAPFRVKSLKFFGDLFE